MNYYRRWQQADGARWPYSAAAILPISVLIVLLFHFPILEGYFQADDFSWLFHSNMASVSASFLGNWGLGMAYRPLTRLSYAVDWHLFGKNATGWHVVNLLFHAANGTQIGMIIRSLGWNWKKTLALVLLFLAFPMDWETVDWISGRTGLLALFFCLLSFQTWLRLVTHDKFVSAVLWFTLFQTFGLMCYEPVLVWPIVFLCSAWPLGRSDRVEARVILVTAAVGGAGAALFWAGRYWLLGTASVRTDATSPNLLAGSLHDLLAVAAHAWRDLTPIGFIIVATVLMAGVIRGKRRLVVLCLFTAAAIAYAPFVAVAGFTERFAYLSSAPLMFAFTVSMSGFSARVRAAILIGTVGIFGSMSVWQANQMRLAGRQVESIIAAMQSLRDLRGAVLIEGIPDQIGGKYLLMGAFEEVAHRELPALQVIARISTPAATANLPAGLAAYEPSAFRYNATTGTFDRDIEVVGRPSSPKRKLE